VEIAGLPDPGGGKLTGVERIIRNPVFWIVVAAAVILVVGLLIASSGGAGGGTGY
jgi:hypothetical protein